MLPRRLLLLAGLTALAGPVRAADWSALVLDREGRPVADAVVSLHPLDRAPPVSDDTARPVVEIAQQDRQYQPYVTPVQVGTAVEFPNRDPIQHHLYSLSKPKRFEKPLYDGGTSETVQFDQPGVVTLGCNIHDWMIAYVVVLPTPWFARTEADGRARIPAPEPGRYRVEVWHPRLPRSVTREVALGTGAGPAEETFEVTLKPDRRIRRGPETGGPRY